MSLQAVSWVLDHSTSTLGSRLALISIANHADKYGDNSCPGFTTIAEDANISRRAAIAAVKKLVDEGHVQIIGTDPKYGTNIYRVVGMRPSEETSPPPSEEASPGSEAPSEAGSEVGALPSSIKPLAVNSLRSRATSLPTVFVPDATGQRICSEQGLNLETELQRFADHHIAKGSRMADWQAAWRTWCNRSKQFQPKTSKSDNEPPAYRQWSPEAQQESLEQAEKLAGYR